MTKIAGDTSTVKGFFSDSALLLGSHTLAILSTFAVMFFMNWKLASIVLVTFPLLLWNIFYVHNTAKNGST